MFSKELMIIDDWRIIGVNLVYHYWCTFEQKFPRPNLTLHNSDIQKLWLYRFLVFLIEIIQIFEKFWFKLDLAYKCNKARVADPGNIFHELEHVLFHNKGRKMYLSELG